MLHTYERVSKFIPSIQIVSPPVKIVFPVAPHMQLGLQLWLRFVGVAEITG